MGMMADEVNSSLQALFFLTHPEEQDESTSLQQFPSLQLINRFWQSDMDIQHVQL